MTKRTSFLFGILLLSFMGLVLVLTLKRTQQTQDQVGLTSRAAPSATLSLRAPATRVPLNSSVTVQLVMNVTDTRFSNGNIRLTFPANTSLSLGQFVLNPDLAGAGGWTFPVQRSGIDPANSNQYEIALAIINNTFEGAQPGEYILGNFTVNAAAIPTTTPVNLAFDLSTTKLMDKSSALNILTSATGLSFTAGSSPTNTPNPTPTTKLSPTPTPKPFISPTPTPKISPTITPKISPTPTTKPSPTITPKISPTPTTKPSPTLTPRPSNTPTPVATQWTVNFRLQGITTQRTGGFNQSTQISFIPNASGPTQSFTVVATNNSNGIYAANLNSTSLANGTYDILIKSGPFLARRFRSIVISNGSPTINLTNRELLAGDIDGNNRITIEDISAILAKYAGSFSVTVPANTREDINSDGKITISDLALASINYQDFIIKGDE